MAQGRLQMHRTLVIAQAGVLFFDGDEEELAAFVHTGSMGAGRRNVAPCNTMVLEAMQRAVEKRRGRQK